MNHHIELVKKWLADKSSVSLEELEANKTGAMKAYVSFTVAYEASEAARIAFCAATAIDDDADRAEYCKKKVIEAVEEYEELTK